MLTVADTHPYDNATGRIAVRMAAAATSAIQTAARVASGHLGGRAAIWVAVRMARVSAGGLARNQAVTGR